MTVMFIILIACTIIGMLLAESIKKHMTITMEKLKLEVQNEMRKEKK